MVSGGVRKISKEIEMAVPVARPWPQFPAHALARINALPRAPMPMLPAPAGVPGLGIARARAGPVDDPELAVFNPEQALRNSKQKIYAAENPQDPEKKKEALRAVVPTLLVAPGVPPNIVDLAKTIENNIDNDNYDPENDFIMIRDWFKSQEGARRRRRGKKTRKTKKSRRYTRRR